MTVNYLAFVEDYESIETLGMGAGKNELSNSNPVLNREISLRNKALWQKHVQDIPEECQVIYEKMRNYLHKKQLEDELV
jgi:hypothetical protein